jgi:hypothetical protein
VTLAPSSSRWKPLLPSEVRDTVRLYLLENRPVVPQAGPKRRRVHHECHRPEGGSRASRQVCFRPSRVDGVPDHPTRPDRPTSRAFDRSREVIAAEIRRRRFSISFPASLACCCSLGVLRNSTFGQPFSAPRSSRSPNYGVSIGSVAFMKRGSGQLRMPEADAPHSNVTVNHPHPQASRISALPNSNSGFAGGGLDEAKCAKDNVGCDMQQRSQRTSYIWRSSPLPVSRRCRLSALPKTRSLFERLSREFTDAALSTMNDTLAA